ncbi:hypothetical protein DVH24_033056 [Malus domestica]|uniref:Uncharacterized protein n=1 Tax=Malus domestica TaxID=3750 RepID=A0A498J979_MALDO|nr:hypothetical protein DVH24_033056 [Malus domestica]
MRRSRQQGNQGLHAEKAKEGTDTTVSKLGQLKDTAAGAAQKAMDYLSGKKEETKQKAAETAEKTKDTTYETAEKAKEKLSETEEEARRKMEQLKLQGKNADRAREARDIEAEKGQAAKENIFSSIGSIPGAIKSKLTHPTDVVEESRAAREKRSTGKRTVPVVEGVEVDVAETRPGACKQVVRVGPDAWSKLQRRGSFGRGL